MKIDPIRLFSDYMRVVGTPNLNFPKADDIRLQGKKLGVINGSNWVSLWSDWFGHKMIPGVKIVNVGNEAVQLNFMTAYKKGEPCPPQENIDCFCRYGLDLKNIYDVDVVMISCSTMNRAYKSIEVILKPFGVPVVQIDEAMMEEAVMSEGRILIIATHGPTVDSTRMLLEETASRLDKKVCFADATIENAFELLGEGKIIEHNIAIADTIREALEKTKIDIVVLAQLSMSVFSFSYPDPIKEFGIKVLNSGETGFGRAGEILKSLPSKR